MGALYDFGRVLAEFRSRTRRTPRRNGPNTKTAACGGGNKYVKLGRRVNREGRLMSDSRRETCFSMEKFFTHNAVALRYVTSRYR